VPVKSVGEVVEVDDGDDADPGVEEAADHLPGDLRSFAFVGGGERLV
jgi:hypothetical protein